MGINTFSRAASGSERLYRVFWFLWVPFLVLTVIIRMHTVSSGPQGIGRSSAWPEYLGYLTFWIAAVWLLIAIWKCAPDTSLRIWFWLSRIYVVAQFIGLLQAMAMLLRSV